MQKVFSKAFEAAEGMSLSKADIWKVLLDKYKNRRRKLKAEEKLGKAIACYAVELAARF